MKLKTFPRLFFIGWVLCVPQKNEAIAPLIPIVIVVGTGFISLPIVLIYSSRHKEAQNFIEHRYEILKYGVTVEVFPPSLRKKCVRKLAENTFENDSEEVVYSDLLAWLKQFDRNAIIKLRPFIVHENEDTYYLRTHKCYVKDKDGISEALSSVFYLPKGHNSLTYGKQMFAWGIASTWAITDFFMTLCGEKPVFREKEKNQYSVTIVEKTTSSVVYYS